MIHKRWMAASLVLLVVAAASCGSSTPTPKSRLAAFCKPAQAVTHNVLLLLPDPAKTYGADASASLSTVDSQLKQGMASLDKADSLAPNAISPATHYMVRLLAESVADLSGSDHGGGLVVAALRLGQQQQVVLSSAQYRDFTQYVQTNCHI